jgi:hypothetical protein
LAYIIYNRELNSGKSKINVRKRRRKQRRKKQQRRKYCSLMSKEIRR